MFKKKKIKVYFDEEEKSIMLKSLIDLHNEQIKHFVYIKTTFPVPGSFFSSIVLKV